jgi:hypothetical protein
MYKEVRKRSFCAFGRKMVVSTLGCLLWVSFLYAQPDTTRFHQLILSIGPAKLLNDRIPTVEYGLEYNPKGRWGLGLNYGQAYKGKWEYPNNTHYLLSMDIKRYHQRQLSPSFTALELMLTHINRNSGGILGTEGQMSLPVARAIFTEYNGRISLKVGGRLSADFLNLEGYVGLGVEKQNLRYQVTEVTDQIIEYPSSRYSGPGKQYFFSGDQGSLRGGFRPVLTMGLKAGIALKTKRI